MIRKSPQRIARPRPVERRAFSLLELTAVIAILGLLAGVAATRWGGDALTTAAGQGIARSLELTLRLARHQAICEGTPAAVVLTRDSGSVVSIQLVRAAAGGDEATDALIELPDGLTVTSADDRWVYDYTGTLTSPAAGGLIQVSDGIWTWSLTVNAATGRVQLVKAN